MSLLRLRYKKAGDGGDQKRYLQSLWCAAVRIKYVEHEDPLR